MLKSIAYNHEGKVAHIRWYIFSCRWFFVALNYIARDDIYTEDPHDHPRSFLTWVISGGYTDKQFAVIPGVGREVTKLDVMPRWSIRYRKHPHIHQTVDVKPKTWTLNIWGPHRSEWGFWTAKGNRILAQDYAMGARD